VSRELAPAHDARGRRFCVVAARFNAVYVEKLVRAALEVLERQGAASDDLDVVWVPGSFELPLACRWAAATRAYDAVLAFGVLIEGETEHFRLVAESASHGIGVVALETGVPVVNGILAVRDAAQAAARTGGPVGNRGAEVALAAVQMADLVRRIPAFLRSPSAHDARA
jgi:6,7-dimethyl-8-ribityllumazine synthase